MNKNFMGISNNKKHWKALVFASALFAVVLVAVPQKGYSQCPGCTTACGDAQEGIHQNEVRVPVAKYLSETFKKHRQWLLDTFFKEQVLPALQLFTEQMSVVAMHQTMTIGTFFDAKHQLETQRLIQELQVQAHKDYQPSEEFCWFGSNVRSLAAAETKSRANAYSMSRRQMGRHMGQENMGGAENRDTDKFARWNLFIKHFCDPQDSDWISSSPGSGLRNLCKAAYSNNDVEANADIDYTRLVEEPRTITLGDKNGNGYDLIDGQSVPPTQKALFSLNNNLYGHDTLTRAVKPNFLKQDQYQSWYMALRSVAAKRSVAENSFNAIVGMKAEGESSLDNDAAVKHLPAILTELGMPAADVKKLIGLKPSYYAQLELLAKKIYQNPDFYAGLYDKPANVQRKSVALKAIELMVDRAIYESQIRQEMVSSVLLSARLREPFKEAQRALVPKEN